jgi:hypothetical protein
MKRLSVFALSLIGTASVALAQTADEHAAHHPDQQNAAATAPKTPNQSAQTGKPAADRMEQNMKKMRTLIAKIDETKDPAERKRLLAEHRQAMRQQMDMMRGMDSGMMKGGMMGKTAGKDVPNKEMMMGEEAMKMCSDMRSRMDMMHAMMEQMMAHDDAKQSH